jgi:hypothetical protein
VEIKWEADDIVTGVRVRKPGNNEAWIIGFFDGTPDHDERFATVSLQDGMICELKTREGLAQDLTDGGYQPCALIGEKRP